MRRDAGINTPADLAGRKVARAFQTTMSVLVKGDLKFFYDAPWEDVHWIMEAVEAVAWTPPEERRSNVDDGGASICSWRAT